MPETVLITEEDKRKVLAQYHERVKSLATAVSVERTDARRTLLQFGDDLMKQFGPDGVKDFAIFWANNLKLGAEMRPGHKDTLMGCRDMAKVVLKIQEINLDNLPDTSALTDEELDREIQAEAMRAMTAAAEKAMA